MLVLPLFFVRKRTIYLELCFKDTRFAMPIKLMGEVMVPHSGL